MKGLFVSLLSLAAAFSVVAGTASSNEFKLDCRTGLRTAVVPEHIQYSTAWATNLTAAQQADAKAVVKVNPCLKTPPKYLVIDMSGGRSAERWPISYLDEVPNGGWTDEYKTEKLVLRYIPAGSFIMGGRATDYPGAVNTNLHMVTLTKPFYIGVFECTQRQWELAMGTRPSRFANEYDYMSRPVENVSRIDIRGSLNVANWPFSKAVADESLVGQLRMKTGLDSIDLPTEAQWEHACRAGTCTALNSGADIEADVCLAADEVARYAGNSDVEHIPYKTSTNLLCDASCGTAIVGSYKPNEFGLYDMHGNVWEQCIDRSSPLPLGSVDPHGSEGSNTIQIRGGGYRNDAKLLASGDHHLNSHDEGVEETWAINDTGLRICLHNATVYPSTDSAMVLVNDSGADATDWTPTEVGTYQLTHEVQMDGVTVGGMESALFKVEGPELFVKANGELVPGVGIEVEKVGGGGEWTIYYTLDGSEPTEEATLYDGPFALPVSATVRAVAISEAGVRSDEARADFTLHDAMSVVGAVARQRYPWNGMVDIDCEITGDSSRVYAVEVTATDLDGGTNLPVKTVHMAARPESAPYRLSPGKYRFTWNADADITGDFDFANVSVSVAAKGGPLVGYARQMTISTDGYAGSETLTNVPVLVRLSTAIAGFDYNDFASPSNGADMVFMDESETQVLPYEIDEWHTNGESLVWVKLPELNRGTKFMLAYGKTVDAESSPRQKDEAINSSERGGDTASTECMKHEVWREYAGVWHMNEDSGTAFDSTEHGLDALPDHGTNKLADVSQMVAYENGACGRARVNSPRKLMGGNFLRVPSYGALRIGSRFVVSGWFNMLDATSYPKLISRSDHWKDGWGIESVRDDFGHLSVVGGTNAKFLSALSLNQRLNEGWCCLSFCYDGDKVSVFENGFCLTNNAQIVAATENGRYLAIGCSADGEANSLVGQYDEIRLRGGSLSADRIKADYDMIANKNFCTYEMITEDSQKE